MTTWSSQNLGFPQDPCCHQQFPGVDLPCGFGVGWQSSTWVHDLFQCFGHHLPLHLLLWLCHWCSRKSSPSCLITSHKECIKDSWISSQTNWDSRSQPVLRKTFEVVSCKLQMRVGAPEASCPSRVFSLLREGGTGVFQQGKQRSSCSSPLLFSCPLAGLPKW